MEIPIGNKTYRNSVIPTMVERQIEDKRKIVIIGGGPASLACAETLRQNNYTGKLVIISEENFLVLGELQF